MPQRTHETSARSPSKGRGTDDRDLTVGRQVGVMRLHAILELAAAGLDVGALRLDVRRAGLGDPRGGLRRWRHY